MAAGGLGRKLTDTSSTTDVKEREGTGSGEVTAQKPDPVTCFFSKVVLPKGFHDIPHH